MKKTIVPIVMAGTMIIGAAAGVNAAPINTSNASAYDAAIKKDTDRDELNLVVTSKVDAENAVVESESKIKVSGLNEEGKLSFDMTTTYKDSDTKSEISYNDGILYSADSKTKISEEAMRNYINNFTYRFMDSNYLKDLEVSKGDNSTTIYSFTADKDAMNEYAEEHLDTNGDGEVISDDDQYDITSFEGKVTTDSKGNVTERKVNFISQFDDNGETSTITSEYDVKYVTESKKTTTKKTDKSSFSVTPTDGQACTSADCNLREQPSTDAAVLTQIPKGTLLEELGYTSNGWTKVTYSGMTGYVANSCLGGEASTTGTGATNDQTIHYAQGKISNYSGSYTNLVTSAGTLYFDLSSCHIDAADKVANGDTASISYKIIDNVYYAVSLTDTTGHNTKEAAATEDTTDNTAETETNETTTETETSADETSEESSEEYTEESSESEEDSENAESGYEEAQDECFE